ncbi:MAG: DUF5689 domain-containing protein [Bacteroidales bacterium]|nr:DUF5689 domain-containing protein [Bacteroidales bacterium]
MKNRTLFVILVCMVLAGCNRWEAPELTAPVYDGPAANKTIADIKAMHPSLGNGTQDSICRYDEQFIVKAVVVSSDEGGNCYKYLTVQDETGGIEIAIDRSSLYNDYPVGQTVYLNCAGLIVGDYHNKYQVGWVYQGSVGRIAPAALDRYLTKDGLPDLNNPLVAHPIEINGSSDLTAENVNCLVKIDGCRFDAADNGLPLSNNDFTTDRNVTFNGGSITVRTSNYAYFRNTLIDASKEYCLYGILSVYNSTYQLTLRTKNDIQFSSASQVETIADLTFDANCFTSGGWSQYPDNQSWKFQAYGGNNFVYHNTATESCDDWLISPELTLGDLNGAQLFLDHQNNVGGSPATYYQVYYSTTYNGGAFNESEWTAFNPNLNNYPSSFALSNGLDLSAIGSQKFRIALRYRKSGTADGTRWAVRGVKITR